MEKLPEENINKIIIGSDHAAYTQKNALISMINDKYNIEVIDVGCDNTNSCNYTDIAHKACHLMSKEENARVILLCTTGTGMNIVANKYRNIRCVQGHKIHQVAMAREHNNVNALTMGISLSEMSDMKGMTQVFLETEFNKYDFNNNLTRHAIRVSKIENKIDDDYQFNNNDNLDIMSNSSKSDNITHTDIFKPIPKNLKHSNKVTTKNNIFPVNIKINKTPFQPRELPLPPPTDMTLFTKNEFAKNHALSVSSYSDSNSMVVNTSDNDSTLMENNVMENKFMNNYKTSKSESDIVYFNDQLKLINDNKNNDKPKSTIMKQNLLTDVYTPSFGKPIRNVTYSDFDSDLDDNLDDNLDDDLDDDLDDLIKNNEVFIEEVFKPKMKPKLKINPNMMNEKDNTLRILQNLKENETLMKKNSIINIKPNNTRVSNKIPFILGSEITRNIPFFANKNTNNGQKNAYVNSNKKIERRSRSLNLIINTQTNMPEQLNYPDSIDTDTTNLVNMTNYLSNCNEVGKLQQDIMRKIVEYRERTKLIHRDLNAEMGSVFNMNNADDTTPDSA
jgi:ribose 5-phosphate isomerase B